MTTECPECGEEFEQVGQHWYKSDCGFPDLSEQQKSILTGLVMGDGSTMQTHKTANIVVNHTNKEFLNWIDEELNVISTGVRYLNSGEKQKQEVKKSSFMEENDVWEFSDVYALYTRTHPYINELHEWGSKWPEFIELNSLKLKILYVSDGSIQTDKRTEGSRPRILITANNQQGNKQSVNEIFDEISVKPKWNRNYFYFNVSDSERLWEYMGSPIQGFEYKWPEEFK